MKTRGATAALTAVLLWAAAGRVAAGEDSPAGERGGRGERERLFVRATDLAAKAQSKEDFLRAAELFEQLTADGRENGLVFFRLWIFYSFQLIIAQNLNIKTQSKIKTSRNCNVRWI